MADTVAGKSFDQYSPPRIAGDHNPSNTGVYDSEALSTSAENRAMWTNIGKPKGKCMVEFANHDATNHIYFRLKPTTAAAATDATNGFKLTPGLSVRFWVDPRKDLVIDAVASAGTPTIKWRIAGPIYDRHTQ
jgi:hypothetical protein